MSATFSGALPIEVCYLAEYASTDVSRPNIYSRVCVEPSTRDEFSLVAVATDGVTVTTFEWRASPDAIASVGRGVHLDADALLVLLKLARKAKLATIDIDQGSYTLEANATSLLEPTHRHVFGFPAWRNVHAPPDAVVGTFGIDLCYVARVYDTLRRINKNRTWVCFTGADPDCSFPAVLEAAGFRFLIMPCRL
jgi:hypothetical protein